MEQQESQFDPDESDSTATTTASSLLDTSKAMSSMLHQALGDRDKFYQYLLDDDRDFRDFAAHEDLESLSVPDLTGTESTTLNSPSVSPRTREIQNLLERLQSEQEEKAQLQNRLSDATNAQACSDVRAQDLMTELESMKRNDRQERTRPCDLHGRDVESLDFSLSQYLMEETQRVLSPPPGSSISSSGRRRIDSRDHTTSVSHWVEKVQTLEKRNKTIQEDAKRVISSLVKELRNKDDERFVARKQLRELEIEMERLQSSEASLKNQLRTMKKRHSELEKSFMRELEEARSLQRTDRACSAKVSGEEVIRIQKAVAQGEKDLESKKCDLVVEQDKNSSLMEKLSLLKQQLKLSEINVHQLQEANMGLEISLLETKNENESLKARHATIDSRHMSNVTPVENSDDGVSDSMVNTDDGFSMDIMESLNEFEAKVDSILEEVPERGGDGAHERDRDPVSSESHGTTGVDSIQKSSPFLHQCQSVVQSLTEMVDNKDEEKGVKHDAIVLCKLGQLSTLIEEQEDAGEAEIMDSAEADAGALTIFREDDTDRSQEHQRLVLSEQSLSTSTEVDGLTRLAESPIRHATDYSSEVGERSRVENLVQTYADPRLLNLSNEEEMEFLDCLTHPIVQAIFSKLQGRCESLENERRDLISETLDLMESSRQSSAAEIEAAVAEIQRKAAHEVWVAEEKAKEHLAALEELRLCGLD